MSKLKSYKIDLLGSYPTKSEAVRRHMVNIDVIHDHSGFFYISNLISRYMLVDISESTRVYSTDSQELFNTWQAEQITAEKFLELTKEDVIEKEDEIVTLYEGFGGNSFACYFVTEDFRHYDFDRGELVANKYFNYAKILKNKTGRSVKVNVRTGEIL